MVIETEPARHGLAVLEDLEARRELHRRDVTHLFEQGQVAVGLDIASDPGIAVPVPGAADVTAFFAEAHILETSGAQLVPQQQRSETGADHQDLALVVQGLARHRWR